MALILVLTDGDGVQGLSATFGAYINTSIVESQTYANEAAGSASSAANSATDAAASATDSDNSAASAIAAASAAASSASGASGSASAASGSATAAATSATNAANSATAAANSATSASGSATSASASATAAATSASNAAATLANALTKANNLSDVANAATAATNIGLGTGNTPTFTNVKLSSPSIHGVLLAEGASAALAVATIGTAGRVLVDNGAGVDPSFQSIGVLMGKNRLINGGMALNQRSVLNGATQTITAGAALAYTVDRWFAYCTGANVTAQQIAGAPGSSQYLYQFTGAASVTGITFGQRIETHNSYDLASQTATLSVDLANSLLTTVTWTAYYANTADTFGTVASPTKTQIATGTFTVNGTVSRYSAQIAIPAAAITGIEIDFSVGAQTSGTWTIGRAQLEPGSASSPFEYRDYGDLLRQCYRYYWLLLVPSFNFQGFNSNTTSGWVFGTVFPVIMRSAPTGTVNGTWTWTNSGGAGGTTSVTSTTNSQFNLAISGTATAASQFSSGYLATGAGASLGFNAEL